MSTIEPAPQLWERSSGRELRWCLTAILCMLLLQRVWHLYSTIDSAPPHVDEASHMQSAYFYKLLFLDRDTEHAAWKNFPSYDQPPVRRYILGLSLHWMRGTVVDTSGGFMDWHRRCVNGMFREPLVRTARHAEPEKAEASQSLIAYCDDLLLQLEPTEATRLDHEDFRQGRVTVFFFGVLATALLVLIGSKLSGSLFAGLLAGLVFLGNKVTVPGFQQVLSDTLWSFFTLLCLVLLFAVFHELDRHKRWPRVIMLAVLAGVCLALALGTKLIAAYMAATVVLAFGASMLLILFKSIRSKAGLPTREL